VNTDNIGISVRLLWKEILIFHGLDPGLGHAVGKERFDLTDDSF
jgi:hypothetical protein